MSIKGVVEARCPRGCEPFEAEVWSFIHAGKSPELRELVAAKECNLILCPDCGAPFFAPAPYIYFDPDAGMLGFVFPESFRAQEGRWRERMKSDFVSLKRALGKHLPVDMEPDLFFGPDGLCDLLSAEDYRGEEREVMECVAGELGLSLYKVDPVFARRQRIPASLPYVAAGQGVTAGAVVEGLKRLLSANDRLSAYQDFLQRLQDRCELPPPKR